MQKKYQGAHANFEKNPCVETRKVLEECKMDLERFYDKKTEGIIVRSRARWHEHGEKSNKYFLNLEKRNHMRKHIRKLNSIKNGGLNVIDIETEIKALRLLDSAYFR